MVAHGLAFRIREFVTFEQLRQRHRGVLVEQVEQLDEVADDLAGRDVLVGADAAVLDLDERHEVVGDEPARIAVERREVKLRVLGGDYTMLYSRRMMSWAVRMRRNMQRG